MQLVNSPILNKIINLTFLMKVTIIVNGSHFHLGVCMRRAFIVMLSILALSLSSCATSATQTTAPEATQAPVEATQAPVEALPASSYTIVTSTSIVADITQQIVGDTATVTSLVGADSDAHVYEPSPADGVSVAKASALIAVGLEFEPWFEDLYAASGSSAPYIEASADITPLSANKTAEKHADEHAGEHADEHAGEHAGEHADEHAGEHADEHAGEHADEHAGEHAHGEFDPHVWQDVQNVIKMVTHISAELAKVMPEHATTLNANAAAYIKTLEALDAEIADKMAQIPAARRIMVTNHDTMSYFAERYGLTLVGTVLGSVTTESSDPGANQIINLVERIKAAGAPAIFIEAFGNDDIVATVAREAGVVVAPALYTDALGKTGSAGQTYVDMMRYNSQIIYQVLGESAGQ
jgi:zinc/manganese transport system substrate-binding protein